MYFSVLLKSFICIRCFLFNFLFACNQFLYHKYELKLLYCIHLFLLKSFLFLLKSVFVSILFIYLDLSCSSNIFICIHPVLLTSLFVYILFFLNLYLYSSCSSYIFICIYPVLLTSLFVSILFFLNLYLYPPCSS